MKNCCSSMVIKFQWYKNSLLSNTIIIVLNSALCIYIFVESRTQGKCAYNTHTKESIISISKYKRVLIFCHLNMPFFHFPQLLFNFNIASFFIGAIWATTSLFFYLNLYFKSVHAFNAGYDNNFKEEFLWFHSHN